MNTQDNRSIEELTQAIELDPTDANAHFSRGHAYHAKDNYDKAIADYTKSIQLNPKSAKAYNGRGLAHIRKDDYDKAIKDLNKAIQLNPKSAKAYNNRGTVHRRKGDYDKAIADYTESIQLNPESAKAYNNRGAAHSRKGDYDQAIKDLNKAIQLNPKSARAYNNRKELQNWIIKMEGLLNQLRNLVSQPSIDQLTFYNFEVVYNQLMSMHQTRNLPEQTIQKVNGYRQKRFSDLSVKAINPTVETCFSLPKLDEDDLQLVGKWWNSPQDHYDRKLLIENYDQDWELGRLLSARSAEKVAAEFYRHYGKKVKDISITQIDENNKSDWRNHDLDVDGLPIDVKNSRRSQNSPDRYTEHYIQKKFKHSKENQKVTISGVFSPYLWPCTLLNPTEYQGDTTIQFLGETTWKKLQVLKNEFKDLVVFVEPDPGRDFFLPPWVFDYPKYVYTEQDKVLKELKNFTNLDALKGATFEFNLHSVGIVAGIDLTEILGNEVLDDWEQSFLNQLRNRIEKYGLSLPFLFLTILEHFLCMAASSKTTSNFEPTKYRRFLFYKEFDRPLGIYDPLKTVDSLIKALDTLWTDKNESIRQFRKFKLKSFNILQAKRNSNEELWTTLIAYCGGRLEDGSACGKNPLVLGKSKHCKYHKLICLDCGFCCKTCEEENHAKSETLENA